MKKVFIILALSIFSFANAQKGTVLVAGSVGFSSQKETFGNSSVQLVRNSFNITPKVGYQFNNNWTVGAELNIINDKSESKSNFQTPNYLDDKKGLSAGAFIRYSKSLSETFAVYADFGAGIQNIKWNTANYDNNGQYYTSTNKGNGFYVGITPALFINVKKGFGLNFNIGGLGYETLNYDNNGGDNSQFNFNFGQTASIGISKNF